ncbi:phosphatase PAP2 family protein [Candidatus Micrarchaeota archaeon]|nr:phosphatase PAP2 family protein [Candidatus Micrarchaeota archaeon]
MDAVTEFVAGLNIQIVSDVSIAFHYYIYPLMLVLLVLTLPFFKEKKKFLALVVSLFLIFIVFTSLKAYYHEARPCAVGSEISSKVPCPDEYSFPSGHTGFAFLFVAATIGSAVFPAYFLIAVFTAFSRIYLGMHYFNDVAGGMVLGMLCYAIGEKIVDKLIKK